MPLRCAAGQESSNFLCAWGILSIEMAAAVSDAELVHAVRSGDAGALGALLERHRASLYASALRILRERADAQDVWKQWDAISHQILTTGTAELYAADCSPDALVEAPSVGYRERGSGGQQRIVEESAAAGVRLQRTDVVASNTITIREGDYHNPPHDPHHCPTTHTEVRLHPDGRVTRLVLYFPRTRRQPTGENSP